jgi:small subunit ribosomal protein S11
MADELITTPEAAPESATPVVEAATDAATAVVKKRGGKKKKFVQVGQAHIQATYNNTIVSLSDAQGNVLAWSSAGKCGFKGPKKSNAIRRWYYCSRCS